MAKESVPETGERRSSVRVATAGSVTSQLELDLDSDVLQLSPGGMRIRLTLLPEVGSRHGFTLAFDGRSIDVSAVVRDVQGLTIPDETPTYEIGLEFHDLTLAQREFIEAFLARRSKS